MKHNKIVGTKYPTRFPNEMEGCLVKALKQKRCGFHSITIHRLVVNTSRIETFR